MEITEKARHLAAVDFGLGSLSKIEHLEQGRVNLSFYIKSERGEEYILQRLHPTFGESGAVVRNVAAVTEILARRGFACPRVKRTGCGKLWVEDNGIWRMMTWLPGKGGSVRSPKAGDQAARRLGMFHRILSTDTPELEELPLASHNMEEPADANEWRSIQNKFHNNPKYARSADIIRQGEAAAGLLRPIPKILATVHGDPKLENFLFDDRDNAVGLIDLDTVRQGSLVWELADALRSWSAVRNAAGHVFLNKDILIRAFGAYLKTGISVDRQVISCLPNAVAAVSLNLSYRYTVDYFEESYFAWDRKNYTSLADQNLFRGKAMLNFASEILTMEESLVQDLEFLDDGFYDI